MNNPFQSHHTPHKLWRFGDVFVFCFLVFNTIHLQRPIRQRRLPPSLVINIQWGEEEVCSKSCRGQRYPTAPNIYFG